MAGNNYEKIREACDNIAEYAKSAQCHTEDAHVLGYLRQMENWAYAALSLPRCQCDVGTAEEQFSRFVAVCHANVDLAGRCSESCPFRLVPTDSKCDRAECYALWAQMPYEEGENDGSK